ncbi:MAG TPA: ABC transporter substrate-binding protein [Ignavibacteriaceae bacterium]|nr:ABC transporter substrate-binding protein [Ignavibacteriaceae bacterium]
MMIKFLVKTNFFLFLVTLIICNWNLAYSQVVTEEEINNQFNSAIALFNAGKYDEALTGFNKIIIDYKYSSKTTASEFFKAKIYFELKQYNQFKYSAGQFAEAYPNSNYVDEVRLLLTKYYIDIANYYNALREILFIIENTNSSSNELKAKEIGEGISAKYLNETQLDRLSSSFNSNKVKSYLLLQQGKYLIRNGNTSGAKNKFEELISSYPESAEYSEAKKLMDFSYSSEPTITVIGVMLPIETNSAGEYTNQPAAEILEGIKFAVDEFNKLRSDKIGLLIRDTEKDVNQIKKIKEEFTSLNSLIAILGPIFSNEVRAALEEFDDYDIPIISPTATDDDLTGLNHHFFQANPSFTVRGKIMAQYIFYVENKRIVSVINSIEGYSPILAGSFTEEFEKLGGKVLKKESFRDDYTDFSEPISKIYSDSLTIEGVYIPLSDNSVTPYIFSEMIKYGVKIPLYGNQDWFTAKGFETAAEISNNLVFESDYFVDFNSDAYKNFSDQFISITGKDVNRNVLYGYDAAKYVLTVLRNTEPRRKSLVDKMISGMVSSGLRNNISFDERRINKFLNIVRYRDGVFELVDKFRLSQ